MFQGVTHREPWARPSQALRMSGAPLTSEPWGPEGPCGKSPQPAQRVTQKPRAEGVALISYRLHQRHSEKFLCS